MNRKMKVLYVTAEISPYASAGGLGEVGRSLPQALFQTGDIEVRRVMPLYKKIDTELKYLMDFPVPIENGYETCLLKTDTKSRDIPTYFIGNDRYFYRDNFYAYEDDGFRFFFFCKAIIEMMKKLNFKPDIVHMNDWHTGFLPLLLKKEFKDIKSVYTIHNIAYQGYIPPSYLAGLLEKKEEYLLGYPQWLNFMKAGIVYADLVTTVSPGYGKEIKTPALSYGMSSLLKKKTNKLVGILNGIDIDCYDPKEENIIAYPYDIKNPDQKKKNKTLLRAEYGLPDSEVPLIAMITRLEYSKGIDVLLKAISYSNLSTFQLIVLGSGNAYYQGILEGIASGYSGNIVFDFNYSSTLAKKIYAAADIYLMPSLFEPCGLGQLYAMRYGAVPIVNPVGGLKDTVIDNKNKPEENSGFYMEEWTGQALTKAIKRAIKAYHSPNWIGLVKNGMKYNASWKKSITKYRKCYESLLKQDEAASQISCQIQDETASQISCKNKMNR